MEEYQTRLDIDRLYDMVWDSDANQLKLTTIDDFLDLVSKLGFNQSNSDKFNFAIINKTNGNIEYWIMSNAYYDYDKKRFIKIDEKYTSHAIQIQAKGTYAGEEEIDANNTSIGVWRNPPSSEVYMDTTMYDYSEFLSNKVIGAKLISPEQWVEFSISAGWSNTLMLDAYGGMTIGGAGFEVDGNGIFPYTRLTSSSYIANNQQFYLLGLLDNAHHPTTGGWECDNNNDWAWFVGLKFPHKSETYMHKDTQNASFVIMYNDMASADKSKEHNLNPSDWHIVFEVDKTGAKGGGGGGGSSDVYPSDNTPLSDVSGGSAGLSDDYSRADHRHPLLNAYPPETHNHDDRYYQKSYVDSNVASKNEIPTPTKRYPLEDVAGGNAGEIEDEYALADHQHDLSDAYAPTVHNHDDKYHTKTIANNTFATKQQLPVPTNLSPPKDAGNGNKGVSTEYARADHSHPVSDNYPSKSEVSSLSGRVDTIENTMPQPSSDTPSSDTVSGDDGESSEYARADHVHPRSNIYATSGHDHDTRYYQKTYVDSNIATKSELPTPSNTAPSGDTIGGSAGVSNNYARADHTHDRSNEYSYSNHQHGKINTDGYLIEGSKTSQSTGKAISKFLVTDSSGYIVEGANAKDIVTTVTSTNQNSDAVIPTVNAMVKYMGNSGDGIHKQILANGVSVRFDDRYINPPSPYSTYYDYYHINGQPSYDPPSVQWYIDMITYKLVGHDNSVSSLNTAVGNKADSNHTHTSGWNEQLISNAVLSYNNDLGLAQLTLKYSSSQARTKNEDLAFNTIPSSLSNVCPSAMVVSSSHNGIATIRIDNSGNITIRFLEALSQSSRARDFYFSLMWHY